MLTLDLVPPGKPGEVRLSLRREPRGGVITRVDDAEGYIRVPSTEPGLYLLTTRISANPSPDFTSALLTKRRATTAR